MTGRGSVLDKLSKKAFVEWGHLSMRKGPREGNEKSYSKSVSYIELTEHADELNVRCEKSEGILSPQSCPSLSTFKQ